MAALNNGQTIYLAFAVPAGSDGRPVAFVRSAVVIDAENRVVRDATGRVTVIEPWRSEAVCDSEAEAWANCHQRLSEAASEIQAKAQECAAKAAASRIVQVPA